MTVYDFTYFLFAMMLAGFIVGLCFAMFINWVARKKI